MAIRAASISDVAAISGRLIEDLAVLVRMRHVSDLVDPDAIDGWDAARKKAIDGLEAVIVALVRSVSAAWQRPDVAAAEP